MTGFDPTVELLIKPLLKFLRSTVKNKKHSDELDKYLTQARDILIEWLPLEDMPMRSVKAKGRKR